MGMIPVAEMAEIDRRFWAQIEYEREVRERVEKQERQRSANRE